MSQGDLKFLSIIDKISHKRAMIIMKCHYHSKEKKTKLHNKQICAVHHLKCLEKRFKKDQRYNDYFVKFMYDIISRDDAEKVLEEEINYSPVWYIPHHGVYHPLKPGKIRVVFYCSVKFQDTSLNDHLIGPDLTNALVSVLCHLRMCDIERMFHQFHVKKGDQDYLQFLRWENGNLEITPSVYRLGVHLFGAASSPGCSNFELKHLATQGRGHVEENSMILLII